MRKIMIMMVAALALALNCTTAQAADKIYPSDQERVSEKAEDVLPEQPVYQYPLCRQRRGEDGRRRRDLRHPD